MRLRTGRKVKRTVYIQRGTEPSDDDTLIGVLDEGWAQIVVDAFNRDRAAPPPVPAPQEDWPPGLG